MSTRERETKASLNSVSRAANVLICLANGLSRVSGIANELDLSVASVHRLLKSLEENCLVVQDTTNRQYYLGYLVAKLASNQVVVHQNLILNSAEEMRRLWEVSGETIALEIQIGFQRIHLHEFRSKYNLKYVEASERLVGSLYAGAAGKMLLSQLKDDEIKLILERINFIKLTPKAVTDKEALMAEINLIREQGYATSFGERMLGVGGLTVPIKNYVYPAALSILGPEERLAANMRVFINELRKSAKKISQNLKEDRKIKK